MEQADKEFAWLLNKIEGVGSILEIGCRYGDSLRELAKVASPGARIRGIDHGESHVDLKQRLRQTVKDLKAQGFDAEVLIANSHDPEAVEWAEKNGPYDFVYIDADHHYESVKQDWEWYGPMAARVGFHDISMVGTDEHVYRLWKEISRTHVTQEMTESSGPGTGIVVMERQAVARAA